MKYNWTKEHLENTVNQCNCWFDWLRVLGIPTKGCNYRTLKNKASLYNIDTSHFNYNYSKTHNGLRILKNRSNEQIFSDNVRIKRDSVKLMYIERILGGKAYCECCGISEWNNKPIVFQLHHIDGNSLNHKLDNIILLCPNCHSQTDNFSNKKR